MPATSYDAPHGRPLRILQVLRAPVGGLFRHVADLTRELSSRGHQVGVVVDALSSDALTAERLEALEPFAKLGIHPMAMPRLLGPGDFTVPFKLRRLAKDLKVDVLHGHGAKGGLHARLARSRGQAAIYTPHGGVLHFPPKSPSGMAFGMIERAMVSRTDTIVFESHFAKAAYEKQIVVPSCPVAVVHNGVTAEEFIAVPPAPDAADFVFVGELRDLKGIFVLVEAMAKLPQSTTLVMAGDGPARAELEARIASLGLVGRVRLVGAQPARPMFARGRAAVVPSLAESLPYIVLEAVAAGLPVIATRVGGVAEIFGPTAASLIPSGDVEALAGAMDGLLADPDAAAGEAAVRFLHVRAGFSVEAMTDGIEAIYRKTLAVRADR
jgi:glycosyltransferase involved in cell wall biosynthesis